MSPSPNLFVYVTHPHVDGAKQLARQCLEAKLIACANIFPPMTSLYWWEGKICEDQEWALIFKTDELHYARLEKLIQRLHPADCPCIMAIAISQGSEQFKHWLRSSLSKLS